MLDNFAVIMDWIRFKKVRFLQDCNPGVPGIIYKLEVDEKQDEETGTCPRIVEVRGGCSRLRDKEHLFPE